VTLAKLSASSVNDSKVVPSAGIIESKLNLDFGTSALDTLISANAVDIASNLALILLREEFANKDQASGYLGLDAGAKVPLSKLNPLTNSEIAVAAAIAESKLNLAYGTSALNTDIQTREESSNKGVASGYCDLDAGVHIPLTRLANLTNSELAAAAGIVESKLNLTYGTSALNTDIQTREESSNKGAVSGYCGLDASQLVPLANLSNLTNTQIAVAAAIIESKLNLDYSTQSLFDDIQTRVTAAQAVAAVEAENQLDLNILSVTYNVISKHTTSLRRDIAGSSLGLLSTNIWNDGIFLKLNDAGSGLEVFFDGVKIASINSVGDLEVLGGNVDVSGPVGTTRDIEFQTSGSNRFGIGINNEAESGSDVGSNFTIARFSDAGAYLGTAVKIARNTGDFEILTGNLSLAASKTVDGVDVSEEPARISTEIDSDISTHAGIATAHQDAPALIATHAGLPSVHHTAYTDAMALAAVDEHLVLESAHATWINCPLEHWSDFASFIMAEDGTLENVGIDESYIYYSVPLPTNRGGKKLRLSGRRLGLADADAANRIRYVFVYGYQNDGTIDQLDLYDIDNMNSVGEHEDSFGPIDCSGYSAIKIRLRSSVLNATQLNIGYVTVRYYYA
jgi:hypothetical protein